MTEEDVPNTTFLKWVVVLLGVLILGVAIALVVTIYKRVANQPENTEPSQVPAVDVILMGPSYGTVEIDSQEGLQVLNIMQSANNVLIVYGDTMRTPRKIIVVNPVTGNTVGQIILKK